MLMAPSEVDGLMAEGLVAEGPLGAPRWWSDSDSPVPRLRDPYQRLVNSGAVSTCARSSAAMGRIWRLRITTRNARIKPGKSISLSRVWS